VHTVANDELFLSRALTRHVLTNLHHGGEHGQESPDGVTLTEWDKALLRYLVRGLHDKEIAQEFSISGAVSVTCFRRCKANWE
jgi:DNA-binding NarL/FixJ family response regulator